MSSRQQHIALIREVATSFGELLPQFVFVGGTVAGLLISDPAGQDVRPTDDVDVVVTVSNYASYTVLQEQLRSKGFQHVSDGPACRFKVGEIPVDVMPTKENILGFNNKWYPTVMETASEIDVDGLIVRIISAPLFICTKLEAFADRGKGDFLMSHDIEDVVAVLEGRVELFDEVAACNEMVKSYLKEQLSALEVNSRFLDVLPALLNDEIDREHRLLHRIELLADCATNTEWNSAGKIVQGLTAYDLVVLHQQESMRIAVVDPVLLKNNPKLLLEKLHLEGRNNSALTILMWERAKDTPQLVPTEDSHLEKQIAVYNWNAKSGLNRLGIISSGTIVKEFK